MLGLTDGNTGKQSPTTIEDAYRAIEVIRNYGKHFEASFVKRMEPLKGDDIMRLSDDRLLVREIMLMLRDIEKALGNLIYK